MNFKLFDLASLNVFSMCPLKLNQEINKTNLTYFQFLVHFLLNFFLNSANLEFKILFVILYCRFLQLFYIFLG